MNLVLKEAFIFHKPTITWVKVFRIIPEFRILWKVSLKMLNLADYNSISHLLSVSPKAIGHLNCKMLIFCRYNASFEIQDFQNFELSPMQSWDIII